MEYQTIVLISIVLIIAVIILFYYDPAIPTTQEYFGNTSDNFYVQEMQIAPGNLVNYGYDKRCMGLEESHVLDNLVNLQDCHRTDSQYWMMDNNNRIRSFLGQYCLSPASITFGDKVNIEPCLDLDPTTPMQAINYNIGESDSYQKWELIPDNKYPGQFRIISRAAGNACLDAGDTAYGLNVVEKPCEADKTTQLWSFQSAV